MLVYITWSGTSFFIFPDFS